MFTTIRHLSKFNIVVSKKYFKTVIEQYFISAKMYSSEVTKVRENPIVCKLDSPEFKSIFTSELNTLASIFEKYNYEIRIAGGAVRDLVLKQVPKDIDFATNATPNQMKEMFTKENIRMLNTKGEKHGTVTARINDKENFEVTTLRIDVVTDGRHAEVEYTKDWMLDANRRDLTINSMFLDLNGDVYDYFYGYDDLENRRVIFVGDADTRIKEDYLRILRYFRFYGRIADQPDNHDELTLRIISQNVSGLERISGERIWSELKRILEGRFAGELMQTILHVGLAPYCGLRSANDRTDEFAKLWARSGHLQMRAITLLTALFADSDDVHFLNERLKMSAFDRELALYIVRHREVKPDLKPLLPYQKLVVNSKVKLSDVKDWTSELLKYQGQEVLLKELNAWQVPRFPVAGNMLREKCSVTPGKYFGVILNELKSYWVDCEFQPNANELLALVPEILSKLEEKRAKK